MRNKIMTIVLLLMIALLIYIIICGINIGNIKVASIKNIKNDNAQLKDKIEKINTLTTVDYESSTEELEETYEKYKLKKEQYEELFGFSNEDKYLNQTKLYDIGYLWKTLGKYATSHNLTIGMDVQKSTTTNLYDLNFTLLGQYVNISEFISNIENDSDLYFRIYNFKMSGSGVVVTCTFTIKDVNIDQSTITVATTLK